jgi:hypothetical protein
MLNPHEVTAVALRLTWTFLLIAIAAPAFSQAPTPAAKPAPQKALAQADEIPERTLKFSPVDSDSTVALSPVTSVPQCDDDGYLFLDMRDPKNLKMHSVVAFNGKKSQTYLPASIPDLHDVFIEDFYPSDAEVAFLVRGSKDTPGEPGAGKSPAGIEWTSYHNYIVEFNRDGSYKDTVELPMNYQVYHFALFPSGDFLVSGYDQLNTAVRLVLVNSSGQIVRDIDVPAARKSVAGDAPYRSVIRSRAMAKLMGSLSFTPYDQDILVWRANSNDPILDVSSGGGVREVPLQAPPGYVLADMIPANDRWVGHFRTQSTPEYSRFTPDTFSYFELRPQDASASAKLLIPDGVPQSLACESDGSYITYSVDKDHKMTLLRSN